MTNDIRLQEYNRMIQQGEADFIDYYEFLEYCVELAKSGNIDALILIGDYLGYNQGKNFKPLRLYLYNLMFEVAKVLPQAYFYLHCMIEQNNYSRTLESALDITAEKLEQLSKEYLKQSADSQFPWAMDTLGNFLITGRLYQKDVQEGLKWLVTATKKSHAPAMSSLGFYYDSKHDYMRATYWFARASILSDTNGISMLALAFRDGKGISKNKQMQIYLEKLISPYHSSSAVNRPQCFDVEMNKILNWKFD